MPLLRLLCILALAASVASPSLAQKQGRTAGRATKAKPRDTSRPIGRRIQPLLRADRLLLPKAPSSPAKTSSAPKGKGKFRRVAGKIVIDIGGEGAHKGAINLNPGLTTTTTGRPGQPIPNLVQGFAEKLPFASRSADRLIVESAPLRPGAAAEMARVIRPGGVVRLMHPSEYAAQSHKGVVQAIGGRMVQSTNDGVTTTVIVAPKPASNAAARP